jgi:argininosuccinate synthase
MKKKVILAYSGGLDTSCCLSWLKEQGFSVVCFSANLGSEFSPATLRKKAVLAGASRVYIKDLRNEFAYEYVLPCLKAGAVYQGKYLLSTALGRPLIAKHLVEVAKKEKAAFVAHGCTAKGNDQVRFEVALKALNPKLKIIAPLRVWGLTSRASELAYAKSRKIPVEASKGKIYSIDKNIWGVSIEAGPLEDLDKQPADSAFIMTRSLAKAASEPQYVTIEFEKGRPAALNNKRTGFLEIIGKLNALGAKHCIGRTDLIEDRTVGIKSREVYEAPAAWILHTAHKELEQLVFNKDMLAFKELVASQYAQLVYQGFWFSRLKSSLDSFVETSQSYVSGKVTLKLYKGNIIVVKRDSRHSLYRKKLATYGAKDAFERKWAEGFINIWAMPHIK